MKKFLPFLVALLLSVPLRAQEMEIPADVNIDGDLTVSGQSVCLEDGTDCPDTGFDDLFLAPTTFADPHGVIYKGLYRFLHDFNYGNNGTVTTTGLNTFLGLNAGNFTMGATATQVYEGSYNVGVGNESFVSNTTGYFNTAIGNGALYSNAGGIGNTATGYAALYSSVDGSGNTAIGAHAGRFLADGVTPNTSTAQGVFLGVSTEALAVSGTNEIVIGHSAEGHGSHTVTLGNDDITDTYLKGEVKADGVNVCLEDGTNCPVSGGGITVDADCTSLTSAVDGDACAQPDGYMFVCHESDGACDEDGEWQLTGDGPNGGDTGDAYWHSWDVSTLSATASTLSVNSSDTSPNGIVFSSGGLYLYVVGQTSDRINQWTLTTPFDLSTASSTANCCAAFDTTPQGVFIDESGTRLLTVGSGSDTVRSYSLSTPFSITSAAFVNSFALGYDPSGVHVSPDGVYMFVGALGAATNATQVTRYTLSTPWDVSTAGGAQTHGNFGITTGGFELPPDGEQIFYLANNLIRQYNLTAPWDLSAPVLAQTFSFTSQAYVELHIVEDGQKLYRLNNTTDSVVEMTMGFAANRNVGVGVTVPLRALHVEGRGMRIDPVASSLTTPAAGDIYTDSTLGQLGYYDGTRWVYHGAMVDQITSAATCTNNAVGASPQALTVTPSTSVVLVTNSDPDGCNVTMSETGAVSGRSIEVVVVSNAGGTVNFADTSGVTEIAAAFNADLWDSLTLRYVTDRWIQEARSDN